MRHFIRAFSVTGVIALSFGLVGCAAGNSIGVADARTGGLPKDFDASTAAGGLAFAEGPAVLAYADGSVDVITWGSGSCPPRATSATKDGTEFLVSFESASQGPCTADMAPTTHSFEAGSIGSVVPEVARISYPDFDEEHVLDVILVVD